MQIQDLKIDPKIWVPVVVSAAVVTGYFLWRAGSQLPPQNPVSGLPQVQQNKQPESPMDGSTSQGGDIEYANNVQVDGSDFSLSELPQNYGLGPVVFVPKGVAPENRVYVANTYVTQGVTDIQVRALEERTLRPIWTAYITNKLPEFARQTPIMQESDGYAYVFWRECVKQTGFCQLRVQKFGSKGERLFGESGRQLLADQGSLDIDYQVMADVMSGYSDAIYVTQTSNLIKTNTAGQVLWKKSISLSGYNQTSFAKDGNSVYVAYSSAYAMNVEKVDAGSGETVWSKVVNVDNTQARRFSPQLFLRDGILSILWGDFRSGTVDPGYYAMQLKSDNGSLLRSADMEVGKVIKGGVSAGIDWKNNLYVVFSRDNRLRQLRIGPNGSFGPEQVISEQGISEFTQPFFVSDGAGFGYVFWRGPVGSQIRGAVTSDDKVPISDMRVDAPQYFDIGYVVSKKLNTHPASYIILHADENKPEGTAVKYFVSGDGGSNWTEIKLGEKHAFQSPVDDMRWKVELSTTKTERTPKVTSVNVSWD